MRLLVVEDEVKTADYLRRGLSEQGFSVSVARDGAEGLHMALDNSFDAIVLDVMLPAMNGWQVLQELRAEGKRTPVLFLTARDGVEERVKGLDFGADDYLVKPFAFSELLARLRALLRRGTGDGLQVLTVADLTLNVATRRAFRAGRRIDLTAKEFSLLWLLMRYAGEVQSRTVIAEQVWDMNFDSDTNVVEVAVRRLRRKVDEPFDEPLIHTIRGMGYVLEAR
ncbi:MAG: heavy metal response regulator transcription factor [Arenicellales bacterium]